MDGRRVIQGNDFLWKAYQSLREENHLLRQHLLRAEHQHEQDAQRLAQVEKEMRKITGGSRSGEGARAWSILASVMRTAEQQGKDVLETIKTLLKAEWAGQEIPLLINSS